MPLDWNPFGGNWGGGTQLPTFGGSSGGMFGGIGDVVEDIRDIFEDVDDIVDFIRGDNGTPAPVGLPAPGSWQPGGFPGSTGVNSSLQNLNASTGASTGAINVVVGNLPNQSDEESLFISFLQAIGVTSTIISWLWGSTPINWPQIAKDLFVYYMANQGNTGAVQAQVPADWFGPGGTTGSGSFPTLPTGPIGVPEQVGGFAAMAMDATPSQVYKAPPGYVTVNVPIAGGQTRKMFVLKKIATAMGLYKSRSKAPITATQYKAVKAAKRWETKLAKMMNESCQYKAVKKTSRR